MLFRSGRYDGFRYGEIRRYGSLESPGNREREVYGICLQIEDIQYLQTGTPAFFRRMIRFPLSIYLTDLTGKLIERIRHQKEQINRII